MFRQASERVRVCGWQGTPLFDQLLEAGTTCREAAGACDVALTTRYLDLNTPLGDVTKAICDGILQAVYAIQGLLQDKVPSLGIEQPATMYTLPELGELPLDVDQACETAYAVNFWMLTMSAAPHPLQPSHPPTTARPPAA